MKTYYPELNFPSFDHKIKTEKDQDFIWEPIRKTWILVTPEEWVRQNLIHYFVDVLAYPLGLMQSECQIMVGKVKKRFDLVVMDKNLQPWLICECKAPSIPIGSSVLQQAANYNSQLRCPFLAVTNGLKHYCFEINFLQESSINIGHFPKYPNS